MSKWDGKFIYSNADLQYNWLQINGDGNKNPAAAEMVKGAWYQLLWNANEGKDNTDVVKTATDPCPKGWRVPTQAEWIAIGAGQEPAVSGTTWDGTNLRLTVPGKESGKNLILPAASPSASSVYFNSAGKLNASASNRAYGFSVRCVQE